MLFLTSEQIQSLKQTNISIDGEKTKERVQALWKAAKSAQKQEIRELADVVTATVYRIYNTGSISAKLAIAFAQVLNISPYYLIGEADEPGECAEADLLRLLEQQGYKKLLAEIVPAEAKPKRAYTRRKKADDTPIEEAAPVEEEHAPMSDEEIAQAVEEILADLPPEEPIEILPEESLQALLHALVIRAGASAAGAAEKLGQVQAILLT
ncbi:MAG: hypothetical protein FWC27_14465 [Firmicutes bacterium]|nr:hypothetical protein [Bacillota bacterium]